MSRQVYKRIAGTGGIGKGILFRFEDNRSLGRNESRLAELTQAKDYCKLHIVFHYLARLLADDMEIIPICKIGDDAYGNELIQMMEEAGMDTKHIDKISDKPTMFSACFQYPDKSGGNITSGNSACSEVDERFILDNIKTMDIGVDTIVVALPEVPLNARIELLKYAKKRGAFCVAACETSEMGEFFRKGGLNHCDLLALNQDETAELTKMDSIMDLKDCEKAATIIHGYNPDVRLWLTCGAKGSLFAQMGECISFGPFPGTEVVNTGGAGDASLAGLLAGFCKGETWEDAGKTAVAAAAMSVECADSINEEINWTSINLKKKSAGWLYTVH